MADSHITLMTRGLRSVGNSVEEKTPATGKQEEMVYEATKPENPPLMTVNTHPSLDTELNTGPGIGAIVTAIRKGANERQ